MSRLITCEHASNRIPFAYDAWFVGAGEVLESHRGWDPGTAWLGDALHAEYGLPLVKGEVSRLLVELNRSEENAELWSEFSAKLSREQQAEVLRRYYRPYRDTVIEHIEQGIVEEGFVRHLSLHSFTPEWKGEERQVDVGILFDPDRDAETGEAAQLADKIGKAFPGARVLYNKPYLGTDDGLTTWLRELYPDNEYSGIELEINQGWIASGRWQWDRDLWVELLGNQQEW